METKTILVVEDEIPLLEAIKKKLENNSMNVATARTVEQALYYLNEMKIDAIWLDHYLLGKEDGLALVAKIKQVDSKWKDLPIFVVSNTASAEKEKIYLELGANKYFVKSDFRLDQVVQALKESLYGKQ